MKIFTGLLQLIESPSGLFSLLTLIAITFVTLKQPSVGGIAFAAFVGIVPTMLAFCEHKETLAGVNPTPTNDIWGQLKDKIFGGNQPPPPNPAAPPPPNPAS